MDIERAPPDPRLRHVLRAFEERRVELGSEVLTWPVPARPHQLFIFHLGEPYLVASDRGVATLAPDAGVVGPQSYPRARVSLTGSVHVFTVLLQPAGLNALVGIDMSSLLNADPAASDVLGPSVQVLRDAVCLAPDFPSRVAAVSRWVEARLALRDPECAIGRASRRMLAGDGRARIDQLVVASGLSARQFQRRFSAQVGMPPKLFARTIRFDRALIARRSSPDRTWTQIAHELGYFDQAHFISDCHAFAGVSPSRMTGDWENVFLPNA